LSFKISGPGPYALGRVCIALWGAVAGEIGLSSSYRAQRHRGCLACQRPIKLRRALCGSGSTVLKCRLSLHAAVVAANWAA